MNVDYGTLEMTVLTYIARCIAQGKTTELEEIGFSLEDMQIVARMNVDELALLARPIGSRIITNIKLDRKVLRSVAQFANRTGAQRHVIKRLVLARANYAMLHHFFSLTKAEVATLRKIHGVEVKGRPKAGKRMDATGRALALDFLHGCIASFGVMHARNPIYQCQAILQVAEATKYSVIDVWEVSRLAEVESKFDWCDVASLQQ